MKKSNKKGTILIATIALGALISAANVSAETRNFTFHMDTKYAHGSGLINCGYVASKADDEQNAYITVTQFNKEQSPTISMWVGPNGGWDELTNPWSWTSTAPRKRLGYTSTRKKGSLHQLCAEQFRSGSVVIGGRWTP